MKLLKNNYAYVIIAIISLILCYGFKTYDIVLADDGIIHYLRIVGTVNSIQEGIIPPLISQHFINDLGYSTNLFYNPIVTYIPAILKLILPLSYSNVIKIFTFITVFLSGFFMYKLCKEVSNNKYIAILSSVLYIAAPYHLTDLYIRFAIGEFTAFIFIPMVLLGLYNLFYKDENNSYYIAIGAVGLALAHTISLYYMCFLSLIFILLNIKKLKNRIIIKNILINVIFIVLISAFFIVPLVETKLFTEYVIFDNEIMNTNSQWVKDNALTLSQIFIKNSDTAEDANVLFKVGTPTLVFLIIGIFVYKKIDSKYKNYYIINFILGTLCLFMASKYFLWEKLPDILCQIQYPWRMLGFASIFLSYICAVNFYTFIEICIDKTVIKNIFFASMVILVVISGIIDISPYLESMKNKGNDIEYENYILSNLSIGPMQINREYLPSKAFRDLNYISSRDSNVKILSGYAKIDNVKKDKLSYSFSYTEANNTNVELPYLYYPCYEIKINGNKVEYTESDKGLICINIENKGNVELTYELTPIMKISYTVSFVAVLLFAIYIIKSKKCNKLLLDK